jgi:hypothetical protein
VTESLIVAAKAAGSNNCVSFQGSPDEDVLQEAKDRALMKAIIKIKSGINRFILMRFGYRVFICSENALSEYL